jgi:alanine racemase
MPVLKANAYGHGLVRVAQLYEKLEADYLGVAVVEEEFFYARWELKCQYSF